MNTLAAILAVLGAAVVVVPVAASRAEHPANGGGLDLGVMSFNIRYGSASDGDNRWELRRDLVAEVLRRHRPDVAGLQEALAWQLDELLAVLPHYATVGVGRDDGRRGGEFAPILFDTRRFRVDQQGTFWLSDTPELPGSKSWGNTLPRICTWVRLIEVPSRRGVYVYNVHLDHASRPSRECSAVLLAQRIAARTHRDPVLLTGDLNAGEESRTVGLLTGAAALPPAPGTGPAFVPLVDTFRALHPDATGVGTYHGFAGRTDGEKIDYVFAPASAEVRAAAIVHDAPQGRYPSDHFPVIARLCLMTTGRPMPSPSEHRAPAR